MTQSPQPRTTPQKAGLLLVAGAGDTPLYQQVKEAVVARILSGDWAEGKKVPSENELVRELGLSRMTVHRALRELTLEGWLERRQGAGSFVAETKPQSAALEIRSIKDEIEARGHSYHAEVHLLKRERAQSLEAGLLGLEKGEPLFHSLIVHHEDGVPVQLEERFVNPAMAPDYLDQDFTAITPYDYLITACPMSEAEHTILAVMPDEDQRLLLKMKRGEPCLLLRRRTWSNQIPVTFALLTHPGDRYRLGARFKGPGSGD